MACEHQNKWAEAAAAWLKSEGHKDKLEKAAQ
jgi:hypothetical protein